MAYATEKELHKAIYKELVAELEREPLFDEDGEIILSQKVWEAIRELKRRRAYKNTKMTEAQIVADMEEHYTIIKRVALVWYNRLGSEGETVHYENTVHRSFYYDDDLFNGVIAFVKVLNK